MLILGSTSDIVRVVTGAASDIEVYAAWADADLTTNPATITPGRTVTPGITTATTTTVVAAPAAATTRRNVAHVNITNNHASASCQVSVELFDGTNVAELREVTLLPGENLAMLDSGEWKHRDAQSAEYSYQAPPGRCLGIAGCIAETMPRETCPEVNTTAPTASGTLFMQALYLVAGQLVSNITVSSATTAAGTPTNGFVGLYDGARNLLATSANQTTTAWAANTLKTIPMTTPYRVPVSGLYYVGVMMTATTIITMKGGTAKTGGQLAAAAPILHGASTTGLTTSLPNPAAAITAGTASIYAAVS